METTDRYRRFLKRRNFSPHTVKAYMNILSQFITWLAIPLVGFTPHTLIYNSLLPSYVSLQ